ncbi:MAG: methyltransferase [Phycisphaeraceae bacterium]|nr:methyltransferase [Phycisphaeraceae bacterium]
MHPPSPHPVPVPSVGSGPASTTIELLRETMSDADFTHDVVAARLDIPSIVAIGTKSLEELMARTASGSRLDTLTRLFCMNAPFSAGALDAILGSELCAGLRAMGMVRTGPSGERSTVCINPVRGLWIASDIPRAGETRASDFVMGIGSSTLTLESLTARRSVGRVLDLGTGCGFHALLASSHAERVIGTDINERAIAMARLNAALNAKPDIEWRIGSFFEPVSGQLFDLIVSNPPFVISPEQDHVYRSAGMSGDGVTEHVVRGAAGFLARGGIAQFLCNWAHMRGIDWRERLATWVEGSGCDMLVLRSETLDASDYAEYWVGHTREESTEPVAARAARWRSSYEQQGIEAASIGMILLHRPSDRDQTWTSFDDAPRKMLGGAGHDVLRRIDAETWLARVRNDELLDARLRVATAVRIDHTLRPDERGWAMEQASARLIQGMAYETTIDEAGARILMRSDGSTTLRSIVAEIASGLGRPLSEVAPVAVGIVRAMIRRGYLERSTDNKA